MTHESVTRQARRDRVREAFRRNLPFVIVLTLFVLLASAYSVIVPLGEAPDEVPHFTYIRYIARHGSLPVGAEEHEGFQPPLYYLIGAGASFWINTDDYVTKANGNFSFTADAPPFNLLLHTTAEAFPYRRWALAWHLLRLLSVAMGATTVWATYRITRELFPDDRHIALGAAAFNAFLPQFIFISGVINNDNLAAAMSALALLMVVKILKGARRHRDFLLLGAVTGLGVLSKASLINLFVVVFVAIGLVSWQERRRIGPLLRRAAMMVLLVVVPFLLIAGWWFVRNQILYGDPMGWGLVLAANALREAPLTLADIQWLICGLYRSFWLNWIGIGLELPFYAALVVPCLLAVVGIVILALKKGERPSGPAALGLAVLGLYFAIVAASLIPWTATVLGTDQARLLYPALPAICVFMFLGWAQFAPRNWGRFLAWGVGGGMLLFATVAPLRYIMPTYAAPALVARQDLAGVQYAANINFGDRMKLVGYDLNGDTWRPGETLVVNLYWEAMEDLDQDYWLYARLVDEKGWELLFRDGCPSGGRYTTDFWKKGDIVPSAHRFRIPDDAPERSYRLMLSMHPFGSLDWLPVLDAQGQDSGDIVILALVPVVGE